MARKMETLSSASAYTVSSRRHFSHIDRLGDNVKPGSPAAQRGFREVEVPRCGAHGASWAYAASRGHSQSAGETNRPSHARQRDGWISHPHAARRTMSIRWQYDVICQTIPSFDARSGTQGRAEVLGLFSRRILSRGCTDRQRIDCLQETKDNA